jgi:flagellar protein FliO/FliZ
MDSLFGAEGSLIVRFVVAFVIVLALIGLTFWLIRRFGTTRVGAAAQRGRQPRLAVIDAAPVDGRRRLVLVRRDNIEHLLMIGGPSDIVVEQNIVRAVPVNAPRDVPVPRAPGAESQAARPQPLDEDAWPPPEPAPRPSYTRPDLSPRTARPLEPRAPEPRPFLEPSIREPYIREPSTRPPLPAGLVTREPPPIVPAAEPVGESAAPDAALASMAQRLEAALRRPGAPDPRPPITPRGDPEPELALGESPPATAPDAATPPDAKAPQSKSVLDSLEEEMANLLGRPPEKQ